MKLVDILKETKSIAIFDADDTLIKTDAWIYVTHKDGKVEKLDPAEFAVYNKKSGDEFDFSEFNKMLRNPKIIKKNVNMLKKYLKIAEKSPSKKVTILTARSLGFPIKHFFNTIGIDPYVVALGTNDPKMKTRWIEKKIQSGYDNIFFIDDSSKNIRAVENLKRKYPDIKIRTVLAK